MGAHDCGLNFPVVQYGARRYGTYGIYGLSGNVLSIRYCFYSLGEATNPTLSASLESNDCLKTHSKLKKAIPVESHGLGCMRGYLRIAS
jgi:hypothetical protein